MECNTAKRYSVPNQKFLMSESTPTDEERQSEDEPVSFSLILRRRWKVI